ncbi:hypothetical protein HED60_15115 [Planctomycetales bacterium ZRK34]|nr:hypothetical protein HED60_15115 [Planctomycetales bacterium ZRK34]
MTMFDYTLAGVALAANLACLAHAIFRRQLMSKTKTVVEGLKLEFDFEDSDTDAVVEGCQMLKELWGERSRQRFMLLMSAGLHALSVQSGAAEHIANLLNEEEAPS